LIQRILSSWRLLCAPPVASHATQRIDQRRRQCGDAERFVAMDSPDSVYCWLKASHLREQTTKAQGTAEPARDEQDGTGTTTRRSGP
jgi:hypothetical protein